MSATEEREIAGKSLDLREKSRYDASVRLSVAPMMDWTDSHCRVFHRLLAPSARLYSEMVHANAVIHGDRTKLLAMDPVEHPVALQLGGSEPALLAQAARIGAEHGFDEINLNCGCPSDRVQAGRFGACLMREPALVADSVAAMIQAVAPAGRPVPVTVKCRLGVDDDHDFDRFIAFIDTVAAAGCGLFVVHARNAWLKGLSPKENREVPPLRYDWAYRLKRERPALQVVVNGGIATTQEALAHLAHVDGAMLGRAAYHDPYTLHGVDAALRGSALQPRDQLLRSLQPYAEAQLADGVPMRHITRHILGLYHGQPGGRAYRQVLSEGAHLPGAGWDLIERAIEVTARRPRPPERPRAAAVR
ncbi:tRNA dihydrouridine(20/20a) synthase DusA [uncultured Luteimonas sp.]|uniref:tRNA dihydrouridine(20/20a) synthase DusA n=1 Tax=uncultured Luteimonas sp. TaxID=453144 RepID=UPI00260F2C75|nr:tRNA dihydrouridine(20/20a) synthase DusA [uncultured Luteimonas sp.]